MIIGTQARVMRPYVDLSLEPGGPLHMRDLVRVAGSVNLPDAAPIPAQVVHPAGFRATLAGQAAPLRCAVTSPTEVARDDAGPAWARLVAGFTERTDVVWTAEMLFRLGFFSAFGEFHTAAQAPGDPRWSSYLAVLAALAHQRAAGTRDDDRAMAGLASDERLWAPSRLLAAAATMVASATRRPADAERTREIHALTLGLAAEVEESGDPDALPFLATYWRAAAFVPHLDGDVATTLGWLDHCLELADAVRPVIGEIPFRMTAYPVLETRARVLRLAGRREEAAADLRTLAGLDPEDSRVLIKLGDTYREMGRADDAEVCYHRASTQVGVLAPLAHLALADLLRTRGMLTKAGIHVDAARRIDAAVPGAAPRVRAEPASRPAGVATPPHPTVEPDAARAVEIRHHTAVKRKRVLAALEGTIAARAGDAAAARLSAAVREIDGLQGTGTGALLCGATFSFWLGEAIALAATGAGDADALADALPRIVAGQREHGAPALRVGVPEDELERGFYQRFLDRINAEDRMRGGPGDVALCADPAQIARLNGLIRLIETTSPALHAELAATIQHVVPFTSDVKTAITNASVHGTVFIRVPLDDDSITIDRFVHEAAHVLLNLALEAAPCHDHGSMGLMMPSPFREGPRPVEGVLHGVYVFCRAAAAVVKALGALDNPAIAMARIQRSLTLISSGLLLLQNFGELNEFGLRIAGGVNDAAAVIMRDFGVAQF